MNVINMAGLCAVWRRQLSSLLGNPLGYVFILAFVLAASAILFLPDTWFARNLADLGPLVSHKGVPVMALLLMVLLPSLAMGSWASERESGTEELLLTLPMSVLDAVLGKYFAIVSYFSIALLCTLSNVVVIDWLGDPDLGLVASTYLGWWLAGLAFAALSLLASVLVSSPAIAFVVGVVFCAAALGGAWSMSWFEPFGRGVLSLAHVLSALCVAAIGVGLAALAVSSKRWRPGREDQVVYQVLCLVFGAFLALNVARIGAMHGVDADLSIDGLSSIAGESASILGSIDRTVTVTAFLSSEVPAGLQVRRKQIEERLKAIERQAGGKVKVVLHAPADAFDAKAELAGTFGIRPRKELFETVSGKDLREVFLSAAVTSGDRKETIEYFDPGLSIEYELVRLIRTVGMAKKQVLGIATTDLEIGPGFDFQTSQPRPGWQLYEEWRKSYDIREVNLDTPVPSEIDVLAVPQPSSLTQEQMHTLHDWIWNGGATLLLEDPMPVFAGHHLAPGQPKRGASPDGQGDDGQRKGDLKPILRALGLRMDLQHIAWSDYVPSHEFRGRIPRNFVWAAREGDSFAEVPMMQGFQALMFGFPGLIRVDEDKPAGLKVTPLVTPTPSVAWGWHRYQDHFEQPNFFGGGQPQMREPQRWTPATDAPLAIAVEVTGTMASAYPKEDSGAKPEDGGEPAMRVGVASPKPINVIVIADIDFAHDMFFQFHRNAGNQFTDDQFAFLKSLRNIQFAGNAIDTLVGEKDLLAVRSRIPPNRSLVRIEAEHRRTQGVLTNRIDAAIETAEATRAEAQKRLDKKVEEIKQDSTLDDGAKANKAAAVQAIEQRRVAREDQRASLELDAAIQRAKSDQNRAIAAAILAIRIKAIAIPSGLLLVLVLTVFIRRLMSERANVPASRTRAAQPVPAGMAG